jgi:hypothetical protein
MLRVRLATPDHKKITRAPGLLLVAQDDSWPDPGGGPAGACGDEVGQQQGRRDGEQYQGHRDFGLAGDSGRPSEQGPDPRSTGTPPRTGSSAWYSEAVYIDATCGSRASAAKNPGVGPFESGRT